MLTIIISWHDADMKNKTTIASTFVSTGRRSLADLVCWCIAVLLGLLPVIIFSRWSYISTFVDLILCINLWWSIYQPSMVLYINLRWSYISIFDDPIYQPLMILYINLCWSYISTYVDPIYQPLLINLWWSGPLYQPWPIPFAGEAEQIRNRAKVSKNCKIENSQNETKEPVSSLT